MHRALSPVTGASNPSRTSPGPIEHKNRRQPPVQQTPNHNNDESAWGLVVALLLSLTGLIICFRGHRFFSFQMFFFAFLAFSLISFMVFITITRASSRDVLFFMTWAALFALGTVLQLWSEHGRAPFPQSPYHKWIRDRSSAGQPLLATTQLPAPTYGSIVGNAPPYEPPPCYNSY
ncbi:hypothetical protein MRX96_039572 [Rhipicephalus microplus]